FAGTNAHALLEEYAPPGPVSPAKVSSSAGELVVLSAKSEAQLLEVARRTCAVVEAQSPISRERLRAIAFTLQTGRQALEERVAFVVRDGLELVAQLQDFLKEGRARNGLRGRAQQREGAWRELGADADLQDAFRAWMTKGKLDLLGRLWVKGLD